MAFRRKGERNQDRGKSELGDLTQAGGSCTGDDEVGSRIGLCHPVVKGGDVSRDFFPLIVDGSQVVVAIPGEMNHLQGTSLGVAEIPKVGSTAEEELIDTCGSLTSPHDKKGRTVGIETEGRSGLTPWKRLAEILPDGSAGDRAGTSRKRGLARLDSQQNTVGPACGETVRPAGDGIRLMKETGNPQGARSQQRRGRGEPPHAENGDGAIAGVQLSTGREALPGALEESGKGR